MSLGLQCQTDVLSLPSLHIVSTDHSSWLKAIFTSLSPSLLLLMSQLQLMMSSVT